MIPTLQFDVSTLSIVYDTQLLSTAKGNRTLGKALEFGLSGDDSKLRALLRLENDTWVQTRAATIASCVWHEKRHFVDFVLTNYGALRLRQFFDIYTNAPTALRHARASGALAVPLDVNLCPIMRDRLGVSEPCAETVDIANSCLMRKRLNQEDKKPLETHLGQIEIGGDAQLEAMAYSVQMYKAHREFGDDLYCSVAKDRPSGDAIHRKYTWFFEFLVRDGLLDLFSLDDSTALFFHQPFIPFCYGALAGRYYGQEQTWGTKSSSASPKERFVSLWKNMKEHCPNYAKLSTIDAWNAVNQVCSKLFGRDVVAETEADYEQEEKLLHKFEELGVTETVIKCYTDLHILRGRMIHILKESPELVLDAREFADNLIALLRPNIVVSAPAGIVGTPPDNIARLSGYEHPRAGKRAPEQKWWWTGMVKQDAPSDHMALRDSLAWVSLADFAAPLAKLFLDGIALRSMTGPELFSMLTRVQHSFGVELVIDRAFIRPRERYSVVDWQYATGKETFRCELSNDICTLDEGVLLDTWDIRLRGEFMRTLIASLPDHLQAEQTMTNMRDWSPWMVKRKYADKLRRIPIDKPPTGVSASRKY